jgi:hypothetical protein
MRDELDRNRPVVQSAKFVIGGAFSDRFRLNLAALAICCLCAGVWTGYESDCRAAWLRSATVRAAGMFPWSSSLGSIPAVAAGVTVPPQWVVF